ncbi:MAG: TlyA family RNA methyltransferase [Acutalibacteraceae bacterium]
MSVRLDSLAALRFSVSVEEAAALIMEGRVLIDGVRADKPGTPVSEDTALTLRPKEKRYASRSGYKLEKALSCFSIHADGLRVCDIGASNGGFTDCLLQHGAAHVFSVDVAYGILDWTLRNDARVTVLERTNARRLTADMLGGVCDMVTADVSFISLTKLFAAIDDILSPNGCCVTLIKPQFEAPQKALGKNGIVRDRAILPPLILSISDAAAAHSLYMNDLAVSPIHGQNGNVEYLARFDRTPRLTEAQQAALAQQTLLWEPDT